MNVPITIDYVNKLVEQICEMSQNDHEVKDIGIILDIILKIVFSDQIKCNRSLYDKSR